jgi:oligopeptide/dipeptide ABC transporter ATP-binding protein
MSLFSLDVWNFEMLEPLLDVQNLRTSFFTPQGEMRAVDGVSFSLSAGKILGVVGESGCGKSVMSLSLMGLIPKEEGRIVGGSILYQKQDLLQFNFSQMRSIRGKEIAMIFQDSMMALNPVFTIGDQIRESICAHERVSFRVLKKRILEILDQVGIASPEKRMHDYPHQLSGGMRQRVMIAMALVSQPKILIADEPTTAMDMTTQAQILDLLKKLQRQRNLALLFITHDLALISELADEVLVMYTGRVVEQGEIQDVFGSPKMPYTQGLLKSVAFLHDHALAFPRPPLEGIEGFVPDLLDLPKGCHFQDRCVHRMLRCQEEAPVLRSLSASHRIACWKDL